MPAPPLYPGYSVTEATPRYPQLYIYFCTPQKLYENGNAVSTCEYLRGPGIDKP